MKTGKLLSKNGQLPWGIRDLDDFSKQITGRKQGSDRCCGSCDRAVQESEAAEKLPCFQKSFSLPPCFVRVIWSRRKYPKLLIPDNDFPFYFNRVPVFLVKTLCFDPQCPCCRICRSLTMDRYLAALRRPDPAQPTSSSLVIVLDRPSTIDAPEPES
jgi:hypothetical protein